MLCLTGQHMPTRACIMPVNQPSLLGRGETRGWEDMPNAVACTVLLGTFLLSGCAFDLAHVSFTPTVCTPQSGKSFTIKDTTSITGAPCGYDRTLSKGTEWNLVGTIPEGEVYKSLQKFESFSNW